MNHDKHHNGTELGFVSNKEKNSNEQRKHDQKRREYLSTINKVQGIGRISWKPIDGIVSGNNSLLREKSREISTPQHDVYHDNECNTHSKYT